MHFSTTSIGEARVTLRSDIRFRPQRFAGESCYVVEDTVASHFYRIGIAEYTFISFLDGRNTIADAMHHTSAVLGPHAFSENDAAAICRWLVDVGLASTHTSGEARRLHEQAQTQDRTRRQQRTNPFFAKIPLLHPDAVLSRIAPGMMWLTSRPLFGVWLVVVLSAGYQLFLHSDQAIHKASGVLTMDNWLWLALTWLILKAVHEFAHALFCKKYGGEVREAGIALVALAPICYVDVTSSWRFSSKQQRICVAAAGMYAEIFLGAVAVFVWLHSPPGVIHQAAFNVVILATVTTVLFNANPLMRFDGYYLLADWLEIPNLSSQGRSYLSYLGRRYFFGAKLTSPLSYSLQHVFIRLYGVSAHVWRLVVTVGIALVLASLFHGAGIVVVVVTLLVWVGTFVVQSLRYFALGNGHEQPHRKYCVALATTWIACLALGCLTIPWPFAVKAPAIVDYQAGGVVRTEVAGFVKHVHVHSGERVQQGQLLAELTNPQLEAETNRLRYVLQAVEKRIAILSRAGDVAAQRIELETRQNVRLQLDERQHQLAGLRLLAPSDGKVISQDLDSLVGTFLEQGRELLTIGNERQKELQVSIAQDDAKLFASQVGAPVHVRLRGGDRRRLNLPLHQVRPGATTDVAYVALTAVGGGPVSVRAKPHVQDAQPAWEFVEPRLTGLIQLQPDVAERIMAGQTAVVRLPIARSRIGTALYRMTESWLSSRWQRIRQS